MATKKNPRVIKFVLTDDDYLAFGRYRILYTEGGRKLVNRQRITYLISGIAIAALFTIFHADHSFTMMAYAIAAVIGIGGPICRRRSSVVRLQRHTEGRPYRGGNLCLDERHHDNVDPSARFRGNA